MFAQRLSFYGVCFMKRFFCLMLCACLLIPFVGCETKTEGQAFYGIPFESAEAVMVPLDTAELTFQNEYYFFTSVADFQKGMETLSQTFDLSAVADYEKDAFETVAEQYTEKFFKDKVLLFVKRYHTTEAVLQLKSMDAVNNVFQIHAQLEEGKEAASIFRAYFLAFDKQYFLSEDSTVQVKTESVETETEAEVNMNDLTVSVGMRCKVLADTAAADALIAQIRAMDLQPSDYNPDNHAFSASDVTVVGRGFYAVFTDDYIGVGLSVYAPNSACKQVVTDAYQTLAGTVHTLETTTQTESETE